jgi:hypothetical protein
MGIQYELYKRSTIQKNRYIKSPAKLDFYVSYTFCVDCVQERDGAIQFCLCDMNMKDVQSLLKELSALKEYLTKSNITIGTPDSNNKNWSYGLTFFFLFCFSRSYLYLCFCF